MEKPILHLPSISVLILMLCASLSAMGQDMNRPALCLDAPDVAVTSPAVVQLRASAAPAPMMPRPGDVNADGHITIADVTDLIDILLSGSAAYSANADADNDGLVTISDVTTLIDMLLTGSDATAYNYGKALYDLNEIYASMRSAGWSTAGNTHQCFGISAYNLMAEVMGDDMIMATQGSGWFWFDACYSVKQRYTSNSWRSHDLWTAYYTWIANANYILEAMKATSATAGEANYVKGQAYAIRAYSYFMLAQSFARTYAGHQSDPCVPLFNGTFWNGSTGALRATVAEVYNQIDADITQAINLLNGTTQMIPDHISYAVALGLRARIALVKEDWSTAQSAAVSAINASGKSIQEVSAFKGLNDAYAGNVMWGADIPSDQVGMYASLWAHMCADIAYGQRAPKQITNWLYNKMSDTDARRAWWMDNTTGIGSDAKVQCKFERVEGTEWEGDYIWMRVEEMYLTAAEAACRRGLTTTARNYLNQLMAKRDVNYSCSKTGTTLGDLTTDESGSLLEEILIQRRLELWGEDGRIYTIRRLGQGFERATDDGWPSSLVLTDRSLQDPESYPWVMTIPQSEYYNYYSRLILDADQNPVGDAYEAPIDVERTPQHLTFTQAEYNFNLSAAQSTAITINLKRPNTSSKPYYALLRLKDDDSGTETWHYVSFARNQTQGAVEIPFNGVDMSMGQYHYTLSLTDLEMSVANSSQRTSTKITVDVQNIGAEGQHISFETATQNMVVYSGGYLEVPVTLTRAVSTNAYRAHVTISNQSNPNDIILRGEDIVFNAGKSTATATIAFRGTEIGNTYSCVLSLSDADIATANPSLGQQITSTTVTVQVKNEDDEIDWESAGTCTFTDYTWTDDAEGAVAMNIPVQKAVDGNLYRILKPLYYVYNGIEDGSSLSNWKFILNADGSISPIEGYWDLEYWGYFGYYDSSSYPSYCNVAQDGNSYDVHFLLKSDQDLYAGGHFKFIWSR